MRIHRFIQITAIRRICASSLVEGTLIASVQDIVDLKVALEGMPLENPPVTEALLRSGCDVKFDITHAGIRVHGRLYSENCANNEALGRLKRGSRRGKAVPA